MKILFVHSYYQKKGGEDIVFENDSAMLKISGQQVDCIGFDNNRHSFLNFLQLPFNLLSYSAIQKKIREFQPDIVHIHNMHFAASASAIRAVKNLKLPCVVTLHNFRLICPSGSLFFNNQLFLDSIRKNFPWKAVKYGVYKHSRMLTLWLAISNWFNNKMKTWQKVDQFIVLNQYAKDVYTHHFTSVPQEKFKVKPNCFEHLPLRAVERSDTFLYVGRLSDEKGIKVLLDAHAIFQFNLIVIGDGPLQAMVKEHVDRYKNVQWLGNQEKSIVLEHMNSCAALILPSVCMEMNPLTMVESLSYGTPIIASRLDTLLQFIQTGFNGIMFDVNDPAALAQSVKDFLRLNTEARTALHENARRTYEQHFTKEASLNQLMEIYESLKRQPVYKVLPVYSKQV